MAQSESAPRLSPSRARQIQVSRKPSWIKIQPPAGEKYLHLKKMLRERGLHTVCEEARCPNVSECWASGTATFMLGTEICTRACRFCAIKTSRKPPALDPLEPEKIAHSVSDLDLHYVVLTSVDRDDLKDGGAQHFAETIRRIKGIRSEMIVEALVPDFRGRMESVDVIVDSGVDVYAHNVETVERLQARVRDPRAGYLQSLETLGHAREYAKEKSLRVYTKSSIMLGLGETETELLQTFRDLRTFHVDILTIGQYLRPSLDHLPVEEFVSPEKFENLKELALKEGFLYVAAGPMVRSSYRAGEFFVKGMIEKERKKNHGI